MYPNFYNKEYVLTNLITLRLALPSRGDVVVFQAPPDPGKDFIKRVMGLPGDTVMLHNGDLYINGQKFDQHIFLKDDVKSYGGRFLGDDKTITVPEGNYFVMGDNRMNSSDSREWGFVPQNKLIGISFFAYWPINQIHLITNPLK